MANPNWTKGVSGNPSGRKKQDRTLVEIAKSHTEAAIKTLAEIMQDEDAPPSSRVSAASAILDRGHGKPPQFSTGDADQFKRATEMSDAELDAILAAGATKRSGAVSSAGEGKASNGSAKPH